jgi:kindlin 2
MIADGQVVGDGSWELKVLVTDLAVERCLRVKGDLHIGGVMLRLVEDLGKFPTIYRGFVLSASVD